MSLPSKKPPSQASSLSPKAITRAEVEALRQKVMRLTSEKPDKAATILTLWIHSSLSQKPKKTKK